MYPSGDRVGALLSQEPSHEAAGWSGGLVMCAHRPTSVRSLTAHVPDSEQLIVT